jgi:hypothetical protein
MKKYILSLIVSLVLGSIAHADLAGSFNEVMRQRKGPFSLNYLQGTESRSEITPSVRSPKGFLFQAAYRNEKARALATQQDFYVANLFSTNYYELVGEYVYNDAYGNHPIDQKALLEKKTAAIGKAASMVRHWALEKYYVEKLPDSALAKSFRIRGISGSEFEQKYATYFFNFYLSSITEDFQYLPAYLLAQNSPIGGSNSLDKARSLVAETYDYFVGRFGANDKRVKPLYHIRNAIHNQLSPVVITMIDKYDKDFPFYREEGNTYLFDIKKILVEYYSFSAAKVAEIAGKQKMSKVKSAADKISSEGLSVGNLLQLSAVAADLKTDLQAGNGIEVDKKAEILMLLAKTSQYIGKEISSMEKVEDAKVFEIILNAIYIEGFLIKDNWDYFKIELNSAANMEAAKQNMSDILSIGMDTLDSAFNPALGQWVSVEKKMENFRDDTIKSSALNLISLVEQKMKSGGN